MLSTVGCRVGTIASVDHSINDGVLLCSFFLYQVVYAGIPKRYSVWTFCAAPEWPALEILSQVTSRGIKSLIVFSHVVCLPKVAAKGDFPRIQFEETVLSNQEKDCEKGIIVRGGRNPKRASQRHVVYTPLNSDHRGKLLDSGA